METGSQQTATTAIIKKAPTGAFLIIGQSGIEASISDKQGSTKRQDDRFGYRLRRHPQGEGHGWPEPIPLSSPYSLVSLV